MDGAGACSVVNERTLEAQGGGGVWDVCGGTLGMVRKLTKEALRHVK